MARRDARVVIIGGGVAGLSVAYHLAMRGIDDVVLIERNALTSGTSWHAAGIIGPLRGSMSMTRLAVRAVDTLTELSERTGQETGYRQTGGLWLARSAPRMVELARTAALAETWGLHAQLIDCDRVAELAPILRVDDLAGALWVAEDGQANPVDICMAYAKGARAGGVEIREGVACSGFEHANGRVRAVRLSSGESIRCESVVNCAGAWARQVGELAGVPVPLHAVEHMYVITEPLEGLRAPWPIVRDLDRGIYLKEDTGKLVLGGFEPCAKLFDANAAHADRPFLELPEDWQQFEPFMTAGLERVPVLERLGVQRFMNGPESFTPDNAPLLGESPYLDGFYVAAGFNSTGIVSSAGAGQAMADWIARGEPPMDLWDADIARFDAARNADSYLRARIPEAVGEVFQMHWPLKQPSAGRDLYRSSLHEVFEAAGAVFGAPAGWERPLWFARDDDERAMRYSYDAQAWWPYAAREASALQRSVALIELSPFTKIDVRGPDAAALMDYLCANDVASAPDRALYTQMLNVHGGIEADLTVIATDDDAFRIFGGAATRQKDLAWIRRARDRLGLSAQVRDATLDEAVLGIAGPQSRALLQSLTAVDLSAQMFGYGRSRCVEIAGETVRLTRISFSGELGYEVAIPCARAKCLLTAVIEAGAPFELAHCGLLALDACRVEKGFRHWGHDIGRDDSPLEAGLGFAVAWDKPRGFLGRDALLRQRERGVTRRLLQFAVEDAHPLLLHDEPIYRDGQLVSYTTSGARGFRTGLSICFAYVPCEPATPLIELCRARYEIVVAGRRHALRPLARPAYDPAGTRLTERGGVAA